MKTVTICNSAKLFGEVLKLKRELEDLGFEVLIHEASVNINGQKIPIEQYNEMKKSEWSEHIQKTLTPRMRNHFKKIERSDAVVVMNKNKDEKPNYIGGNTLIDMGIAFYLKKPIFLTNPIPEDLSYAEEIKGIEPIILNDLKEIKKHI